MKLGDDLDANGYNLKNASLVLNPALTTDGNYTGIIINGIAGTTLAFGKLVCLSAADSQFGNSGNR